MIYFAVQFEEGVVVFCTVPVFFSQAIEKVYYRGFRRRMSPGRAVQMRPPGVFPVLVDGATNKFPWEKMG